MIFFQLIFVIISHLLFRACVQNLLYLFVKNLLRGSVSQGFDVGSSNLFMINNGENGRKLNLLVAERGRHQLFTYHS